MNEATLRDYLLRKLPEAEAKDLEERLLGDHELFILLRTVETDMLDDYASGKLDDADRQAIQQRYRQHGSRIKVARALAQRTNNVVPMSRRPWIAYTAAAAAVAVLVIGAVFFARMESSAPAPTAMARQVKKPIGVHRVLPVVVFLVSSRAATQPTSSVTIASDVETVQLRVRLDPADRFESYRAELQSSAGVVWRAEKLTATMEGEELILSAAVPANVLSAGPHELALQGGGETLGYVSLEVHR